MTEIDNAFLSIRPEWRMEQHGDEIRRFAHFLVTHPGDIKRVLELGVRHGGTSALWHQLCPEALVVGVDRVGCDSYQEPEFSQRAAQMMAEFPRYTFIQGDTEDPATLTKVAPYGPFDFLFIDADHSYEAVSRDFARFGPLVRAGGLVAFHDIVNGPCTSGVHKFWNELKGDKYEFVTTPASDWGGIGAVRV